MRVWVKHYSELGGVTGKGDAVAPKSQDSGYAVMSSGR